MAPRHYTSADDEVFLAEIHRPVPSDVELDPRWEWHLVQRLGMPDKYIRGRCRHTEVIPVESVTGDVVAQLCQTCDTQLPSPVTGRVGLVHTD